MFCSRIRDGHQHLGTTRPAMLRSFAQRSMAFVRLVLKHSPLYYKVNASEFEFQWPLFCRGLKHSGYRSFPRFRTLRSQLVDISPAMQVAPSEARQNRDVPGANSFPVSSCEFCRLVGSKSPINYNFARGYT